MFIVSIFLFDLNACGDSFFCKINNIDYFIMEKKLPLCYINFRCNCSFNKTFGGKVDYYEKNVF